jgi:hypothetical protein
MSRVGFESTIPVAERAKTFHVLDRAPTVIGVILDQRVFFFAGIHGAYNRPIPLLSFTNDTYISRE